MKVVRSQVVGALGALILLAVAIPATHAEPMVVNGDFESDVDGFVVWPGYVGNGNPEEIPGWTGEGARGINPIAAPHDNPAPFRDNGDNSTHVAFLQGESAIEQDVTGFAVGSDYTLSLDFNARNCCGDLPIADVLLDGIVVGSSADIFPEPGAVIPVGDTNPWYHAEIEFTAPEDTITLRIQSRPATGGDATVLLDNLSFQLVPEPASASLMLLGCLTALGIVRRR